MCVVMKQNIVVKGYVIVMLGVIVLLREFDLIWEQMYMYYWFFWYIVVNVFYNCDFEGFV